MKKVFCLMAAIAALVTAVSCNKDLENVAGDEYVTVTYNVSTGSATKVSYGNGTLATDLTVQVFRKDPVSATDSTWTLTSPAITKTKLNTSPESWTVTIKLAKSYTYRVGFWAQSPSVPAGAFTITDLSAVAVDYTKFVINNDSLDVFCNYAEIANMSGTLSQDVELTRPLSQINLIATDYSDYSSSVPSGSTSAVKAAVRITGIPDTLNVITKATRGNATMDLAAAPVVGDVFESTTNYYLSMAYILGNQAEAVADANFVLSNGTQASLANISVSNMPYRANYKTNIIGAMFTGGVTYHVVIAPAFTTPAYEPTL